MMTSRIDGTAVSAVRTEFILRFVQAGRLYHREVMTQHALKTWLIDVSVKPGDSRPRALVF